MAAEEEATCNQFSHGRDCILQAGAIAGGIAGPGRAEGSGLAIGQVTAKCGESGCRESFGQSGKQRGFGIRACAVREDEDVLVWSFRDVEKSDYMRVDGAVDELENGGLRQALILNRHEIRPISGERYPRRAEPFPESWFASGARKNPAFSNVELTTSKVFT